METQLTGMKPKDVIGLKEVPLVNRENYSPKDIFPEDGLYCYLIQPSEEHDDQPLIEHCLRRPSKVTFILVIG